tara:strand:+ start:752 stop:1006 length:255 start_codon:yes stop_codon:yes gene_type:complete
MRRKKYTQRQESDYLWEAVSVLWPEKDLPIEISLTDEVDSFEIKKIEHALGSCDYNRTHAARALGIGRTTLLAKCKKLNIALEA